MRYADVDRGVGREKEKKKNGERQIHYMKNSLGQIDRERERERYILIKGKTRERKTETESQL